jgi:hypothetical protein
MDAAAFDRLSRTLWLAGSRRAALGALLASAGGLLGRGASPAAAQGCQPNGTRCRHGADCCSGRCKERHRDTHGTCRQADNQGVCTVELNVCTTGSIICGTGSFFNCFCFVTTRGRSFCAENSTIQPGNCTCASNQECEQRVGEGAKCVVVGAAPNPNCSSCGANGTACMAPCPNLNPCP